MDYTIDDMMLDIASNIERDCAEGVLTRDSIIKRLKRLKEAIIDTIVDW